MMDYEQLSVSALWASSYDYASPLQIEVFLNASAHLNISTRKAQVFDEYAQCGM